MTDRHTAGLRPGAVLEARMAAAYRDGLDTARGRQPRINPWNGVDPDPRIRVLSKMWARGYSSGHPFGPGQAFDLARPGNMPTR